MKMLQSLNTLASKISPGSPTNGNSNKVQTHNNNSNEMSRGISHHPHPYSKKPIQHVAQPQSGNGDQKENT